MLKTTAHSIFLVNEQCQKFTRGWRVESDMQTSYCSTVAKRNAVVSMVLFLLLFPQFLFRELASILLRSISSVSEIMVLSIFFPCSEHVFRAPAMG